MTESEEKFLMLINSSIAQAKDIHKLRISKETMDKIGERVFTNIKMHIDERYGQEISK